eukprot:scaffold171868_cov17-Tisochrysis_lutea.AAC.1
MKHTGSCSPISCMELASASTLDWSAGGTDGRPFPQEHCIRGAARTLRSHEAKVQKAAAHLTSKFVIYIWVLQKGVPHYGTARVSKAPCGPTTATANVPFVPSVLVTL